MNGFCYCGATENLVLFAGGWRCPSHTPAALAGEPEPGEGRYCAPYRCYCGRPECDSSGSYTRTLDPATATVTDLTEYRNAQANTRGPGAA